MTWTIDDDAPFEIRVSIDPALVSALLAGHTIKITGAREERAKDVDRVRRWAEKAQKKVKTFSPRSGNTTYIRVIN